MMRLTATLGRLARPLIYASRRLSATMTVGVRAVVLGSDNRIALVRHRYVHGWHLPGGGVEIGESAIEALSRELREEAAVVLTGEPELVGVFLNKNVSLRDHVFVYSVRNFEIADIGRAVWKSRNADGLRSTTCRRT